MPGRLTSRTSPFDGDRGGANPFPAANLNSALRIPNCEFETLGGETESRLAYTQKSEGQNLPERPIQSH